jgi:plasmid stabilization system protein ParE
MAVTVLFHRLANREFEAACRWYAQRNSDLELAFRDELDRAVERIADNPDQWPTFRTRFRWVRTRRFPYLLYYHIVDADCALVLAVAHSRRRPGYWLRRKSTG